MLENLQKNEKVIPKTAELREKGGISAPFVVNPTNGADRSSK